MCIFTASTDPAREPAFGLRGRAGLLEAVAVIAITAAGVAVAAVTTPVAIAETAACSSGSSNSLKQANIVELKGYISGWHQQQMYL